MVLSRMPRLIPLFSILCVMPTAGAMAANLAAHKAYYTLEAKRLGPEEHLQDQKIEVEEGDKRDQGIGGGKHSEKLGEKSRAVDATDQTVRPRDQCCSLR